MASFCFAFWYGTLVCVIEWVHKIVTKGQRSLGYIIMAMLMYLCDPKNSYSYLKLPKEITGQVLSPKTLRWNINNHCPIHYMHLDYSFHRNVLGLVIYINEFSLHFNVIWRSTELTCTPQQVECEVGLCAPHTLLLAPPALAFSSEFAFL